MIIWGWPPRPQDWNTWPMWAHTVHPEEDFFAEPGVSRGLHFATKFSALSFPFSACKCPWHLKPDASVQQGILLFGERSHQGLSVPQLVELFLYSFLFFTWQMQVLWIDILYFLFSCLSEVDGKICSPQNIFSGETWDLVDASMSPNYFF